MKRIKQTRSPRCRKCSIELVAGENLPSGHVGNICKECKREQQRLWRKANPEKSRAISTRQSRRIGNLPMSENKSCASYLGIYVAERVLSRVFKNVKQMPNGNPGYDFICGRGYRIDIKSACVRINGKGNWVFAINRNQIADYFLCLAFDNRENLNPLYMWLLPGSKFNHSTCASLSPSTIHKWDEYRLDVDKVVTCCNIMKS